MSKIGSQKRRPNHGGGQSKLGYDIFSRHRNGFLKRQSKSRTINFTKLGCLRLRTFSESTCKPLKHIHL